MTPPPTPAYLVFMDRRHLAARLGAALRAARRGRGLALAALAARTGLGVSAISRAETGRQLPDLPTLVRLAGGLRVSPARLLRAALEAP